LILKVLTDRGIFRFKGEGERGDVVEVEIGNKKNPRCDPQCGGRGRGKPEN